MVVILALWASEPSERSFAAASAPVASKAVHSSLVVTRAAHDRPGQKTAISIQAFTDGADDGVERELIADVPPDGFREAIIAFAPQLHQFLCHFFGESGQR